MSINKLRAEFFSSHLTLLLPYGLTPKFVMYTLTCMPGASARKGGWPKNTLEIFPFDCNSYVCYFPDCAAGYCGGQ